MQYDWSGNQRRLRLTFRQAVALASLSAIVGAVAMSLWT